MNNKNHELEYDLSICYYQFTRSPFVTKACEPTTEFWKLRLTNATEIIVGYCSLGFHSSLVSIEDNIENWRNEMLRAGHTYIGKMTSSQMKKLLVLI